MANHFLWMASLPRQAPPEPLPRGRVGAAFRRASIWLLSEGLKGKNPEVHGPPRLESQLTGLSRHPSRTETHRRVWLRRPVEQLPACCSLRSRPARRCRSESSDGINGGRSPFRVREARPGGLFRSIIKKPMRSPVNSLASSADFSRCAHWSSRVMVSGESGPRPLRSVARDLVNQDATVERHLLVAQLSQQLPLSILINRVHQNNRRDERGHSTFGKIAKRGVQNDDDGR